MAILWIDFRMNRAKGYMKSNLQQPLSLGGIADEMGLSVSRFSHLFKSHTGLAPKQWLKRERLQKAARLLVMNPDLSIKEIAGEVCFNSSRLSREFRKEFGVRPSDYRERAQGISDLNADSAASQERELVWPGSSVGQAG